MMKQKQIVSPHPDVSKKEILGIEDAISQIKATIVSDIAKGVSKTETEAKISSIVRECLKKVDARIVPQIRESLKSMAQSNYYIFSENMKVANRNLLNKALSANIVKETDSAFPSGLGKGVLLTNDVAFRNQMTTLEKGLPLIREYQSQVRAMTKVISADPTMTRKVNPVSGKVTKMSARNLAEMTARYQANQNDLDKVRQKVKLWWISSHADCSPRCAPWQGKLYSTHPDLIGKTIDGHRVNDLDKALSANGGNSIINGYNCRHYLIEYTPGSDPPKTFSSEILKREYAIDQKQRNYENHIRQLKLQQRLSAAEGDTQLAKRLSKRWHQAEKEYKIFSLENKRPFYLWRTQISKGETIESNKRGTQTAEEEIAQIEEKAKDRLEEKIGSSFSTPKSLVSFSNCDENAKIRFRQRGDLDREGKAVKRGASRHILEDHGNQVDEQFLNRLANSLVRPDAVLLDKNYPSENYDLFFEFENAQGKKRYQKTVVAYKEGEFLIITSYVTNKKK